MIHFIRANGRASKTREGGKSPLTRIRRDTRGKSGGRKERRAPLFPFLAEKIGKRWQFRSAAFSYKVPKGSSLQRVKHFITKHYCPQTSTKILKKHLQDLKENFGLALSAPDILPPTKKQTVSRLYPGSANRDEVALSLLRKKTTQSNQLFNL